MVIELIGPTALGKGSAWESRAGVSGSVPSHLVAISYNTSQPSEMLGPFQVSVMEEKVKLSNLKSVGSAGSLHRKYQDLLKAVQGKDERIGQLEAQLEKQVRAPGSRAERQCPLQHLRPLAPAS